jgi:hypothetical protein
MEQYIKPYNHGKPWTESEEIMLMKELESKSIIQIAQNHQRTVYGIEARIKYVAYKMFLQNIPIEKIEQVTNMKSYEIMEFIKTIKTKT